MKKQKALFWGGSCIIALLACLIAVPSVPAADSIKIGLILTTTGQYAGMGTGEKMGAELAAGKINESGGIKGRKIELIFEDDEGDTGKGTTAIRKLITVDKVSAVYGTSSNVVSHAISLIAEDMKVPLLSPVPSANYTVGKKFVFQNLVNEKSLVEHVGRYILKKQWKKIGILHDATEYGMDYSNNMEKWLSPKGVTVVRAKFAVTATDVTPQWLTLKNENVNAVFLIAGPPAAPAVAMKNRKQLGIATPVLASTSLNMPKFLELAGEAAEGMLMSTYLRYGKWAPEEQRLINTLTVKYPKEYPTIFHAIGWDGINLLAKAIEEGGDDKQKIRDAMENIKNYDGAIGIYNTSPTDHNGLTLEALCMVTVKDGKFLLYED